MIVPRALLAVLLLSATTTALGGDVRALSHPAGVPGSTSNGPAAVSSKVAGTYAPASCFSADGRFATFQSWGQDLVAAQVDLTYISVYVTDLSTGATSIVSHDAASDTTTGNGPSYVPAISADGRWIAYASTAGNLVTGMTSGNPDGSVFLYDRMTGSNLLVSHRAGDPLTGGNGGSFSAWVSDDGGVVAFLSQATNLVASQTLAHDPGGFDVYLFERSSGAVTLVSHAAGVSSRTGNDSSFQYYPSADGRTLTFASLASNLVPGQVDVAGTHDVFLFDRIAGTTSLVSHVAGNVTRAGSGFSFEPTISADGRFVAYMSYADDLVAGMVNANSGYADIFLYDRLSGSSSLVSHAPGAADTTADSGSLQPRISADGSAVAYMSLATQLVVGQSDPNGMNDDVFVYDRLSGVNTLVSRSALGPLQTGNAESLNPVISADGNRIAFESKATDLVPGQVDTNGANDVFLFDRPTGRTILVSRTPSSASTTGNAGSDGPLLSSDVNLVAFNSDATDLGASDTNGSLDAFLFRAVSFGSVRSFSPLSPCRLVDTRSGNGLPVAASSTRDFVLTGLCGVPADAAGLSLNVTVTQPGAAGFVDVFPAGLPAPPTSVVLFRPGQTRANSAMVALGESPAGSVTVRNASAGTVHVILDVNGLFR